MSPLLHVWELNSPVLRSLVEWNLYADCQHVYSGKMTKLLWWHYMWTWMCTRYGALLSICCLICWISTACTTLQPIAHFTLFECVNDPVMPPGTGMPSHTLRASNRLFFGGFSFFFSLFFLEPLLRVCFPDLSWYTVCGSSRIAFHIHTYLAKSSSVLSFCIHTFLSHIETLLWSHTYILWSEVRCGDTAGRLPCFSWTAPKWVFFIMAASSSIRPLFVTLFCLFFLLPFLHTLNLFQLVGEVSQIVGGLSMSSQWALWYCKCVHFPPFSLCATVCMLYPEQHPASKSIHFVLAFVQRTFLWLRVDVCFMGEFLQALKGALSRKSYWNKSCLCYYYCYCSSSSVVHSSGFGQSFGKTFVHTHWWSAWVAAALLEEEHLRTV